MLNRDKLESFIFDYFWEENVYEAQSKAHISQLADAILPTLKELIEVME